MEEDRALTNLGPTEDPISPEAVEDSATTRQPQRRIIGSRAAAAERASTPRTATDTQDSGTHDQVLQAKPKPRAIRTLNQIPPEILNDASLNEAIALLPANYNFEIQKTIHRIRTSGAKNVALQFPEGLLLFAPTISDIITSFCPGTDTLIMGDVTYGACCVDDYTARALGCDLLVHYGHSCLVPVDVTKGIKTLYVFVTIGIDLEHLVATVEHNFRSAQKIALVGTVQFNATLHAVVPRLKSLGFDAVLPRAAPLSAGEILGCTAPTLTATSSKPALSSPSETENPTKASARNAAASDADMILYVGDGRFHLESILIASPTLRARTYRYDPYTRRLTHETYEHEEMHSLRRQAINTARKSLSDSRRNQTNKSVERLSSPPTTWGIILGTLGRQGNPYTLELITAHLDRLKIPWITLLLSEITPQKLALMSADIAIWVQIACPRLSIDWGYAFPRPLLSPFEACIALDIREGGSWASESNLHAPGGSSNSQISEAPVTSSSATQEGNTSPASAPPVYPMDFYGKDGLGRTKAHDVPDFSALEIEVT